MARTLRTLIGDLARRVGALYQARRPMRAEEQECLARELAEMTLATVGTDAGPLKGVRVATLARAIAAAGFDGVAGVAAVIQAIEAKAGQRKPRQKGT